MLAFSAPGVNASAATDSVLMELRHQARALAPIVRTPLAHRFLAAAEALPPAPTRTIYFDPSDGSYLGASEASRLADSIRTRLQPKTLDGWYYYAGRYGAPLNYTRAIELVASAGLTDLEGKRVLDFGYGRIAHLRMLACLGADVVGIDVDPLLRALYSEPGDQGPVPGIVSRTGSVRLVDGRFPIDPPARKAVARDYDLILSKNTLKGGHEPHERERQSRVVNLGVSDSIFVRSIYACLRPGGRFLIYNLASPQGNGRCPFPEPLLRATGFEVLAYDLDDTPEARSMRHALRREPGDAPAVPDSVTALYTLLRKPGSSR